MGYHCKGNVTSKGFYLIGGLNIVHGLSYVIQPLQSFYMASEGLLEHSGHNNSFEDLVHNPYMGLLWAGLGLLSIYLGIRDRRIHKLNEVRMNELRAQLISLESRLDC